MGGEKKIRDYRKTTQYRTLKRSLLDLLAWRGMTDQVYLDKVDEYMDFWVRRCELRDDVRERGLSVVDDRGRWMENRSVSLEIQVSRQMMTIFSALGLNVTKTTEQEEDEL